MKIVHFADLHLDAQFAWAGAGGEVARRRRQGLRDALGRIAALAREVHADALFCGGDLYENDRVAPDTSEFLRATFAELDPLRVFLAPGNHDWYGPQSVYAVVEWSPNVHVFRESTLQPVELGHDLTLWGGAHRGPANTPNFLDQFHAAGPGRHIALFHGSERSWLAEQGNDKQPHAPFDASQIETAGLDHAFLGHYHRPKDAERHTYPGNPEPLAFGEDGERGAVIATIDAEGGVQRERRGVASGHVQDVDLDLTGCATREQVRERVDKATDGLPGVVRLTVSGEIEEDVVLHEDELVASVPAVSAARCRASCKLSAASRSEAATGRGDGPSCYPTAQPNRSTCCCGWRWRNISRTGTKPVPSSSMIRSPPATRRGAKPCSTRCSP